MPFQPEGVDPFTIPNPDPTRHYRWLSDKPEKLALWLRSWGDRPGYTLEPADNAARLGFSPDYSTDPAGRIRYGFNVLASIPIEEFHKRQQAGVDAQVEKVSAAEDGFMAAFDGVRGAKPFKREVEDIADRKAHATREGNPRVFMGAGSAAARGVRGGTPGGPPQKS